MCSATSIKYITVKTSFRGFHKYTNAPDEVAFLRNKHRHVFGVRVSIEVDHSDRDVEFFILQQEIDQCISENFLNKELEESCEMIAETIAEYLLQREYKILQVEVDEDGENAGGIRYE